MSKIRIRHGANEIELEGEDIFIDSQLRAFYKRLEELEVMVSPASIKEEILESEPKKRKGKVPSPAEFYKSKKRTDNVSRILIFGKYLEEFRNQSQFGRADINKLVKEARLARDIHSQYFTNAVKQGLLRSHTANKYSLTLSAEETVASM